MSKILITIGRQTGSGGAEIAHLLADKLGIKCYDKKLIELAAEKLGLDINAIERCDEAATNSLLYSLSMGAYIVDNGYAPLTDIPLDEKLYMIQRELIIEAAKSGPAVFIGRCSDYILQDSFKTLNVFIHAPLETRVERVAKSQGMTPLEAKKYITKSDKRRANHYNFHTDGSWGKIDSYDICIDSSFAGINGTVEMLAAIAAQNFDK